MLIVLYTALWYDPCTIVLQPLYVPVPGWSFQMGSAYQFHSWRVFVLVCAFPSVAAISALTTMPESPRFFLEVNPPTTNQNITKIVATQSIVYHLGFNSGLTAVFEYHDTYSSYLHHTPAGILITLTNIL